MSGFLTLDPRHSTPLHVQLEQGIRALIAHKTLGPGDQLPTVRQLAVDLSINANTVARVYGELERAGVLETRRGIGTFVASQPVLIAHKAGHREKQLAALVRRCLTEAAAEGFSADDVMREIKGSSKRASH